MHVEFLIFTELLIRFIQICVETLLIFMFIQG